MRRFIDIVAQVGVYQTNERTGGIADITSFSTVRVQDVGPTHHVACQPERLRIGQARS